MKILLPLKLTAALIADTISRSLYKDPFACLMEIIRNGLCASMSGEKWIPGKGEIAIEFCRHPLIDGGRALTVLDRGHGFNQRSKELISSLGRTMNEKGANPDGDFDGAAQKGIGRFAAFGCMKAGESKKIDPNVGFYILTRDTSSGPITLISMIPSLMEEYQGTPIEELPLNDSRLGIASEIKGTFSMVVIPNPVFVDADEIIEGIQWRLPRKLGQMFKLTVNGEKVTPPPLSGKVHFVSGDGEIEVHVDVESDPHSDTGIWFTDATTGFRVVLASRLGRAHVPPPYCYNGLKGDIFVHGLLKNQTASRGGVNGDYLRSDIYLKVKASLFANRASVEALLGNQRSRESQGEKEMDDLISIAAAVFGPSQVVIDEFNTGNKRKTSPPAVKNPDGERSHGEREGGKKDKPTSHSQKPVRRVRELRAIRLGEYDFLIDTQRLDPHRYAQSEGIRLDDEVVTVYVNDQYALLPTREPERREHIIAQFLFAAACADPQLANRAQEAMDQVMQWRSKMFARK